MTMPLADPLYTANMTDHQRAWFYAEYERARKDEVVGILLAIFLGGFGIHQFYLGRNTAGIIYLLLSWTGIPTIFGWVEAFFMSGRVRQYNAAQAMYISNQIRGDAPHFTMPTPPSASPQCSACGGAIDPAAIFCNHCGATLGSQFNNQPAT